MSFTLTGKAKSDLKAITVFTEQRWGKEPRNLYIKQMDDAFHRLAAAPMTGAACDYIKSGYRKFPQGSYVIFYRNDRAKSIEIVRILHKSMDVESKFINP